VKKESAKTVKASDPLVNRTFEFEGNDITFTGRVVDRLRQGCYLVRMSDSKDHVVSVTKMERLGFTFNKKEDK
jgi:hypothetical protein